MGNTIETSLREYVNSKVNEEIDKLKNELKQLDKEFDDEQDKQLATNIINHEISDLKPYM